MAQHGPAPGDPTTDGPEFHAESLRDLLIGQLFDVAQHDRSPEIGRERCQRTFDVGIEMRLRIYSLGTRFAAGKAFRVVRQRVEPNLLLAAHPVQEEVCGDPVQPALKGAGRVIGQRPEHPHEDILGEVLGIVCVPRKPVSEPIHPITVISHDLFPRGWYPRGQVRPGDVDRDGFVTYGVAVRHRTWRNRPPGRERRQTRVLSGHGRLSLGSRRTYPTRRPWRGKTRSGHRLISPRSIPTRGALTRRTHHAQRAFP